VVVLSAMMADVEEIQVVVAHRERATLRVGEMFLKIDADQARTDVEVEAMAVAPVPTPEILWRRPPVLALAALPGRALGRLQEPSTASPAAWAAAGAQYAGCHGDLQITHVFVDADKVTGIIDWSEASQGCAVRPRHPDACARRTPRRRHRRLRCRRRLRGDPRMVVVSKPDRD
jgi:hypothetical protein